jgi:putative salt-induced outer membrane protein YdiY
MNDSARRVLSARTVLIALAGVLFSTWSFAQDPVTQGASDETWAATAGAGFSLTRGNSDTVSYNLSFDVIRTPEARNEMQWTGLYLRGTQAGALTVNRTSLGFRDRYTLTRRVFLFGKLDYLRDTFKRIDLLVSPTAGVGYTVVDSDSTSFSLDTGVGAVWERNSSATLRASGAVSAAERFEHQLTDTAAIKQTATALLKTTDFADALYTFSAGLTTRISDRVQLSIELLDTFKNRPPTVETGKNDLAIVTAITAEY